MKFHLYDKHRQLLKEWRNEKKYSAEEVSEMLGHHKSWLGQIERGRLVSIKYHDLITLLSILFDIPVEKLTEENIAKFIYDYDPFYEEPVEPITTRIFNKIIDIIPSNELDAIHYQVADVQSHLNEAAETLDENELDDYWLMLSYLNKNLSKDTVNTIAFASLPYHLIFKKYEDDMETIQKIYNDIAKYLEEWIDKEELD